MSNSKLFKIISVGVLALALAVFTGGVANAVVTLNATSVTSDVALTLTGAAASTWSTSAGALTLTSAAAATWSTAAGALTITGTGGLTLDSATTTAVNLGTAAAAKTITIGNAASTEAEINALLVDINAGATGITIDSAGALSLDATAASNFTVTGAGLDLTLASVLGSVAISSSEAVATAIAITASDAAGGIDVNAGTGTIDIDQTGIVAGNGITVNTADAGIALTAAGADNGDVTLTVGDDYVANVTGIWDVNVTGAGTVDAAGISLDATAASNFTVTGAGLDLTLASVLGSVVISSSEAIATAIALTASDAAGGIDINAGTGTIDIDQTGIVAGNGITVNTADAGIALTAAGADNGDVTLTVGDDYVANVTGIWDVNVTGAGTVDAAGISLDATAASNFTVTGAGLDLTLASVLGSVLVESTEDAALAIRLHANGGVSETIQIHSDLGTGAASLDLLSDVGGITLSSGLSSADAINLNATGVAGGIDIDSLTGGIIVDTTGAISLDAAAASNFTVTGAGLDLTLASVLGSVLVSSTEDAALAIYLYANGGTSETIRLRSDQGTGHNSIELISDAGGIRLGAGIGVTVGGAANTVTTASNVTYTAAQLCAALLNRDPAGLARTDTTDTAANLVAACVPTIGDTHVILLQNTADNAEAITIAAGVGVELLEPDGQNVVIEQNNWAKITFTNVDGSVVAMIVDEVIDAD